MLGFWFDTLLLVLMLLWVSREPKSAASYLLVPYIGLLLFWPGSRNVYTLVGYIVLLALWHGQREGQDR